MKPLSVVTFKWGPFFTAEHVNRLRASFRRNCFVDHDFYCVTDDSRGLDEFVIPVQQWKDFTDFRRNYRRLRLLANDVKNVIPAKRMLMLDLDQVVVGDLTPLLVKPTPFAIYQCPANNRHKVALNPSFLLMDSGCKSYIWETFKRDPNGEIERAAANGWSGTDQAIISNLMRPPCTLLDRKDGLCSWRDEFAATSTYELPPDARLVSFYGDFDPSNAESQKLAPWIVKHWRSLRMDILDALIERHGWTHGVELGVFSGATYLYLLRRNPHLRLIGVDTWKPGDGPTKRDDGYRSYAAAPLEQYAKQVVVAAKAFGKRARLKRMTTLEAAKQVPDASLDFVFIDADHTEQAVRDDITAWMPKLKSSGYLLGHDSHFPGVRAAIESLVPGWTSYPDYVWCRAKC